MSTKFVNKFIAVLIACILVLTPVLAINAEGASVYTRPQKHLYLVLDDSSSMMPDKDVDANYALQTLFAMTDKTDTIDIYFLNAGEKVYENLDITQKSNDMINSIKVNYPKSSGSTPYSVVSTAQKDLKKAVAADDDGEYWLVVMTDGGFNYPSMDYEADLLKFAQTPLKNGNLPNVMCIAIDSKSVISKSNATADNIYTMEGNDLIASMNEAALAISGRIKIENRTLSSDGKTLSFDLPYPAKNIVILTQNTQTSIVNSSSTSTLNTTENYTVARPVPTKQLDKSTVCFITESSGASITPGKVSFTFDKPINNQNTLVVVEPAIGLMAHFYNQDGNECDPSQLKVGEKAKLVYTICDPHTQQVIDESIVQGGVKYYADIDGQHFDKNDIEFTVGSDKLQLDMYAEFSDGFVLDIHSIYENLQEFRIVALNLSTGTFSADINKLSDADVITAKPTHNGVSFVNDEFNACKFEIKGDSNPFKLRVDVKQDSATGTYTITPKAGWLKVFTPVNQEIEVTFTSDKGEVITETVAIELTGTRNWLPIILFIVSLALIIYMIVVYVKKPKFPLDLRLNCYCDHGDGIDLKHPEISKTIFSPGMLNFASILPFPGPVKLNVGKVFGMGKLVVEASKNNKETRYLAYVNNVTMSQVTNNNPIYGMYFNNAQPVEQIDFVIKDINMFAEKGFPGENEPKNDCLHLRDGEFISEQEHHSNGMPPKLLRYVRKKTLKDRGEI